MLRPTSTPPIPCERESCCAPRRCRRRRDRRRRGLPPPVRPGRRRGSGRRRGAGRAGGGALVGHRRGPAHASFAGQQDTYLNVVGADAVLDAVRRCWASLWTDRAVAYRADARHRPRRRCGWPWWCSGWSTPQVAGVLFTANPVTGRRHQAVHRRQPRAGRGRGLRRGQPGPLRGRRDGGAVVERRLGDKRLAVRALPGGGTERVELAGDRQRRALPDRRRSCRALAARSAARVEAHYGAPQDIEWAIDADGHALADPGAADHHALSRCRPSTRRRAARVFFCLSLAQGLTRPITPMGLAAFRLIGGVRWRGCSASRLARDRPVGAAAASPTAGAAAVRRRHRPCCATRSGGPSCPRSSA